MSLNTQNWKQFAFLYDIDTDTEQVLTFFKFYPVKNLIVERNCLNPLF